MYLESAAFCSVSLFGSPISRCSTSLLLCEEGGRAGVERVLSLTPTRGQ